jgi:hypothetical protein
MNAPALAVVAPVRMNVTLASATFSWSWWLSVDRISSCVMSLECSRCVLGTLRRTIGSFLDVLSVKDRWSLGDDVPSALVFVEEMNRFREHSVQVGVLMIVFI